MHTSIALLVLSVIVLIYKRYAERTKWNPQGLPYPPGPRPLLRVLGNILDVPATYPWIVYASWRKKYGIYLFFDLYFMLRSPG